MTTRRSRSVFGALVAAAALLLSVMPATAATGGPPKPTPNPWQMRHWPQTQPWQQPQSVRSFAQNAPRPIDPQNYELPDTMTWDDYKAIPNTKWNDPAKQGSIKNFKGALVLVDYPNASFIVSQPKNSTLYGNPKSVSDIPRAQVPQFYQDFLNTPSTLNQGHTIHEYWMEDSDGRYGVDLNGFGPYQMPAKILRVRLDNGLPAPGACPSGRHLRPEHPHRRPAPRGVADVGEDVANAVRLRVLPQRRAGRVVHLAGVRRR